MKFLKALALVVLVNSISFAFSPGTVVRSSFTATDDAVAISSAQFLTAVLVSTVSAGGELVLYNSSHTTENQVASIDLDTIEYYSFHDLNVKGIFYETSNNADGVTILYRR